ncbi:signal transduction histidine kinase [Sphingomonas zeicaulis]|uniref:DAHL domain-containing protein n=1 Tax=Sphingomonas zeicaulis TaxID=1632740 RepID=UPI003D20AE35
MKLFDRIAVALLVALLSWLMFMGSSTSDPAALEARGALDAMLSHEDALRRDVLSARAGLLNNYDPIAADIAGMNRAASIVDHSLAGTGAEKLGTELVERARRQEVLANRFTSIDALLHNSLAYLRTYSRDLAIQSAATPLRPSIDRLSSAMLNLTLVNSSAAKAEVAGSLDALARQCRSLRCPADVDRLLAHGRLLNALLPEIGETVEAVIRNDERLPDAIRAALLDRQANADVSARRYRVLLYLASLLLLYLLVRWGLAMRAHAAALGRQAALEHAIASLSRTLLATPVDDLDRRIVPTLGDLAAAIGADEALLRTAQSERIRAWPEAEAALARLWPVFLEHLPAEAHDNKHRVLRISRTRPMPGNPVWRAFAATGLQSCLCIVQRAQSGSRQTASLLCFGFQTESGWDAKDAAILGAVLDSIMLASDRATAAKERRRLQTRLAHASRMEAVGAFASGIAHNFNNLLGAITGHAEMALDVVQPCSTLKPHLEQIELSAARGRDLVKALLGYGRRSQGNRAPTDLDALVRETCQLAQAAIGNAHEIEVSGSLTGAPVVTDATQLQQTLLNLCSNAADASPPGTPIRVRCGRIEVREGVEAPDELEQGGYATIAVVDDGIGMSPEVIRQAFEPFFTTRPSGTGLGLSTAREIAREHGGTLTLASAPGAGTTATIWIPLMTTAPATDIVPRDADAALPVDGAGRVVLLLAPTDAERLSAEDLLAALGYEPVGFTDGWAAVAALEAAPSRFDVVLAMGMADDNGISWLFERARSRHPGAPRLLACHAPHGQNVDLLSRTGATNVVNLPLEARGVAAALAG